MKLFIDESGNTGETLSLDSAFNFKEQPYYVLSGILLNSIEERKLSKYISQLIEKYKIGGDELKAKNIYKYKPCFLMKSLSIY